MTSDVDVNALEQRVGCSLPADYRRFLLTNNGGIFEAYPTTFCVAGPRTLERYLQRELLANRAGGESRTPEGFSWHHDQDGETMQLVPYDVHLITGRHVSVYQSQESTDRVNKFTESRTEVIARPESAVPFVGPKDSLQVFFRLRGDLELANVDWNHETMMRRIPPDFLPIACDGSGNLLCIALGGRDRGSVYFWDWYTEDVPPSYSNVYFVANSFDALWSALVAPGKAGLM